MILVTAATGQVGRQAARELVGAGAQVRALVRDPAARGGPGRRRGRDGLLRRRRLARARAARRRRAAARGPGRPGVGRPARARARSRRAGGRGAHRQALGHRRRAGSPIALMREHEQVDARVRAGSAGWTLLRPHLYMQNLLRATAAVRAAGTLTAALGGILVPLVDTRDVGAAAAAVLLAPAAHSGRTYALTGPEARRLRRGGRGDRACGGPPGALRGRRAGRPRSRPARRRRPGLAGVRPGPHRRGIRARRARGRDPTCRGCSGGRHARSRRSWPTIATTSAGAARMPSDERADRRHRRRRRGRGEHRLPPHRARHPRRRRDRARPARLGLDGQGGRGRPAAVRRRGQHPHVPAGDRRARAVPRDDGGVRRRRRHRAAPPRLSDPARRARRRRSLPGRARRPACARRPLAGAHAGRSGGNGAAARPRRPDRRHLLPGRRPARARGARARLRGRRRRRAGCAYARAAR